MAIPKEYPMHYKRREFLATLTHTLGASVLVSLPVLNNHVEAGIFAATMTVGQVIDLILKEIPGAPFKETVDTLKSGKADQQVSGIVSTSFATVDVIEKTIKLGANFIIAHEPTFYNHLDQTDWLESDEVYAYKRDLLNKHNIAVWRFHDYIHSHRPDGVQTGVLTALDWVKYADQSDAHVLTLPNLPLKEIVTHVKKKLGIPMVRVIGEPTQVCRKVVLFPGAAGGRSQIKAIHTHKPDLFICGELSEWETSEYIRDARQKGEKRALIVLGHAVSEEPGMEWLVQWLQPKLSGIKVTHVPAQNPFTWM